MLHIKFDYQIVAALINANTYTKITRIKFWLVEILSGAFRIQVTRSKEDLKGIIMFLLKKIKSKGGKKRKREKKEMPKKDGFISRGSVHLFALSRISQGA